MIATRARDSERERENFRVSNCEIVEFCIYFARAVDSQIHRIE